MCWVLDLTGVSFFASTGLALLVHYHRRCRDNGNQLRIVATHRTVLRPITMTGLADVLTITATIDEAISRRAE